MSTTQNQQTIQRILVPTDSTKVEFFKHLSIENNRRILFSAPFGSGKSYFLNNFFTDLPEQVVIKLHPVDYSVASNEDIFELIKYDILNEMTTHYLNDIELVKEDFGHLLTLQEFLKSKDYSSLVLSILSSAIPEGGTIKDLHASASEAISEYQTFKKSVDVDEEKTIMDYMLSHRYKKGSIREADPVTLIIRDFGQRIKTKRSAKKLTLILDDLDRLDPEHTFRIFNVFTSHDDSRIDENKFFFDQVIFVCDVENINHMFKHKFGEKVDFGGYMDKFYSSHIFHFNFKNFLKEYVSKLLAKKDNFEREIPDGIETRYHEKYGMTGTHRSDFGECFKHVISSFIDIDEVRIRSFDKFQGYYLPAGSFKVAYRDIQISEYPFLVLMKNLKNLFPRYIDLDAALQRLSAKFNSDYSSSQENTNYDDDGINLTLINYSLPFILDEKKALINREETEGQFEKYKNEDGFGILIYYTISRYGELKLRMIKIGDALLLDHSESSQASVRPNPYYFLLQALRSSVKRGFLWD